jgi:hypothetical protein
VTFSPAFKWSVILLIPLTIGGKLVEEEQAPDESKAHLVEFLSRHKFEIAKRTVAGIPVIDATLGVCEMTVVEAAPDGWMRDFIRDVLGATEHQFTVFRGNIYREQPNWLTLTDHWWSKSLRRLGLARRDAPVIAVSATESCHAERLPWDELSSQDVRSPLLMELEGRNLGEIAPISGPVRRFG